jgi:peptidoglycan/LPS O-acetylase OafA/YrhL
MHQTYRPDIDGLRAVAITAVVAYHAFPQVFQGGFAGVDVFFVISGYLISNVIFQNADVQAFSITDFYSRRIRRIFPALATLFVSTLAIGWFVLSPRELAQLGKHVVSGSSFISNFALWRESGYFDSSAEFKPLLHLWSLAVEEQFYIFYPALMFFVLRRKVPRLPILGALTASSFALCLFLTSHSPAAAFYNPLSRIWEILLGCVIAHVVVKYADRPISSLLTNFMATTGLILIATAYSFFNSTTQFPGLAAVVPTCGAGLLILSGPNNFLSRHFLSNRIAVLIGLISFPLYLWHWPLLVFLRIHDGGESSASSRAIVVLLSILLSIVTYQLIERPLRFRISSRSAVLVLISAVASLALCGQVLAMNEGFPWRFSGEIQKLATFQPDFKADGRVDDCWLSPYAPPNSFSAICDGDISMSQRIVLWGDSHAARFYPGLRSVLNSEISISQFTRSACPGLLDFEFNECRASNATVMKKIKQIRPQTIIIFGRWNTYIDAKRAPEFKISFKKTIEELRGLGVTNIYVMGPAPFWSGNLPTNLFEQLNNENKDVLPLRSNFRLTTVAQDTEKLLRSIVEQIPNVTYFSVFDSLCLKGKCLVTVDGTVGGLTTWDYGHLTTPGAAFVAEKLQKILK